MSWTDERVATLKKLWDAGDSAASIARQLGGVTRCAVLGLINRKGWARHHPAKPIKALAPAVAAPRPPRPRTVTQPRPMALVPPPAVSVTERKPNDEAPRSLKSLLERGHHECAYPVGAPDPQRGQLYCSAATDEDYCARHRSVMYRSDARPMPGVLPDMSRRIGKRSMAGSGRRFSE